MNIEKVAKKIGISVNDAKEMVAAHHEREHLLAKKEVKKVRGIEIDSLDLQWVDGAAKKLKISRDAVIAGIIRTELKKKV